MDMVMLDLHRLDRYKAARLLNNVITIVREPFTLGVMNENYGWFSKRVDFNLLKVVWCVI